MTEFVGQSEAYFEGCERTKKDYEKLLKFVIKISRVDEPSRRVAMQIVDKARELLEELKDDV